MGAQTEAGVRVAVLVAVGGLGAGVAEAVCWWCGAGVAEEDGGGGQSLTHAPFPLWYV